MENLIFSLNATVPIFLLMILGLLFHKIGWIDDVFAQKMNKFVFVVPLPVLVFSDLATVDFHEVWNMKFVLFCFLATFLSITLVSFMSLGLKERALRGEFIQASYRSSAALLGIAFIQNIYGNAGMAPVMIIGSVPLYNIMAVLVLSLFKPGQSGLDKAVLKRTAKGIVTNPIILGIVAGLLWSALGLPIAIMLGFRREELVAILVMLGSATTVSCFVMAKNMGHEGVLSSSVVMLTTLFSAFTLTGWLYILKSMNFI